MSLETAITRSFVGFLFASDAALITSGWLWSTESADSGIWFWFLVLDWGALFVESVVLVFLFCPTEGDDEDDAVRFLVGPEII